MQIPTLIPRGFRGSLPLWILALGVLLFPATPRAAADSRWVEDSNAYKGWTVSFLEIRGLEKDLARELGRGLALSGQRKVVRTRRPLLYPQTLETDVRRSRLFLAREGYPYAEISPVFEPSSKGRRVRVILDIEPGPPVLVDSSRVVGVPPALGRRAASLHPIAAGSRFSETRTEQTAHSLERMLQDEGYARASVETDVTRRDSTRVELRFAAVPGAVCEFEEVRVEGTSPDLIPLVRKTISIRPGQRYSRAVIEQARDNLRLLGLFRQIRLDTEDAGPGALRLTADLIERKPRMLEVGAGFWTEDLLTAHARWEHRNLFRAGRGMDVTGSYSRFAQTGGTSFWWPALFGSRTRGVVAATVERQSEESYDLVSTGLELGARYRPSLFTTVRAGMTVSRVDVNVKTRDPAAFVEQGGLLTIFSAGWSRDSSNNRVYPTSGAVTWAALEWAPPGGVTESHYVSLETAAIGYLALSGEAVLAGKLDVGLARPTAGSVDLLPNKRFYAGGPTSMRGFKRHKLGPMDASGAPLGGEAKLEGSVELRFPIVWRFRGALFGDTGQVWQESGQVSLGDLEMAAGPALMVITPVGPVRADVGFRLTNKEPREPKWVLHISIGQPY